MTISVLCNQGTTIEQTVRDKEENYRLKPIQYITNLDTTITRSCIHQTLKNLLCTLCCATCISTTYHPQLQPFCASFNRVYSNSWLRVQYLHTSIRELLTVGGLVGEEVCMVTSESMRCYRSPGRYIGTVTSRTNTHAHCETSCGQYLRMLRTGGRLLLGPWDRRL